MHPKPIWSNEGVGPSKSFTSQRFFFYIYSTFVPLPSIFESWTWMKRKKPGPFVNVETFLCWYVFQGLVRHFFAKRIRQTGVHEEYVPNELQEIEQCLHFLPSTEWQPYPHLWRSFSCKFRRGGASSIQTWVYADRDICLSPEYRVIERSFSPQNVAAICEAAAPCPNPPCN